MIPKKISTRFSQDPEVGVKCRVIRGWRVVGAPARRLAPGCPELLGLEIRSSEAMVLQPA
jgi:hypothetical protein